MIRLILMARALRAFADGYVAVLLPAYLLALGHGQLEVGLLSTATLLGSALATLAVGRWGHRFALRRLLLAAAVLMIATGLGFASMTALWPLLVVAFIGPLNPGGGDVTVFLPLEHSVLAASAGAQARTGIFARYSFLGSVCGALGALAVALPDWLAAHAGWAMLDALRAMFVLYGAIGAAVWALYARIPPPPVEEARPRSALGPSRGIVLKLAALFSVDSFAGGLVINALLALWLFERFGLSLTAAGAFFFWTGLLSAVSQLAAAPLARRIGLINTMVFTHLPASLCLIGAALAPSLGLALGLLLVRSLLSQMDVPARSAYVMSVVTAASPRRRAPRSLEPGSPPGRWRRRCLPAGCSRSRTTSRSMPLSGAFPPGLPTDGKRSAEALVQLDDVAVGVADEDRLRVRPELHRAAAQRNPGGLQRRLGRVNVVAQQREVRDAGMLLRHVHEDVRLGGVRGVQDQVELHPRRVVEDGHRLGSDRTGGFLEAEQGVEGRRALEAVDPNADVGKAPDGKAHGAIIRIVAEWNRSDSPATAGMPTTAGSTPGIRSPSPTTTTRATWATGRCA